MTASCRAWSYHHLMPFRHPWGQMRLSSLALVHNLNLAIILNGLVFGTYICLVNKKHRPILNRRKQDDHRRLQ